MESKACPEAERRLERAKAKALTEKLASDGQTWQSGLATDLHSVAVQAMMNSEAISENPIMPVDIPVVHHVADTSSQNCDAALLDWKAGPIFETFPWQLLADEKNTLPFYLDRVMGTGKHAVLWLRSIKCHGQVLLPSRTCSACFDSTLSRTIISADQHAQLTSIACTPYQYLNHEQLVMTARSKSETIKELRDKVCLFP